VTLQFAGPVAGVGATIQADGPGQFSAQIQVFNGATSLGSFTVASDPNGDAFYIGVLDQSGANITAVVFSLTSCVGVCADFALGPVSLNNPAGISPNPIDLASPPASFAITGQGFANNGFGLPVVNFMSGGVVLGQARATGLSGSTMLTVPFPTDATSLIGRLPGLAVGAVQVQIYNQTGPNSYALVGNDPLIVNDTRPCAVCVTGITPGSIDLASSPASFTVAGQGFADDGFGLPVVNFLLGGAVVGQARATALTGLTGTTLTVPFPTNATSLIGPLPGLAMGAVQVRVYNQTSSTSYALVGSVTLSVNDTRPCALCVISVNPSAIDLASPPTSFTVAGQGFANSGFGLPVVNFLLSGAVLGQARATALTGSTTLIVPFPTSATSLIGALPGLAAGALQLQVYNQTGPSSYALVGSVTLTVSDTRPCAACVTSINPGPIDLASPPSSFTIVGGGFANSGFGLPVVNFLLGGALLGQARAAALTGSTTLTVPFPTNATSLIGPLPGLAAGAVQVQVYNQTGPSSYVLVGSVTLTVSDTRPCAVCVTSINPSPIDLISPPTSFTIAGQGFENSGFGLPVVNFLLGGVVLGQARATALTGLTGTTLAVPFPTNVTSLIGPLPGLATGAVQVQAYNQTGPSSYALAGSVTLTVNDTRPCAVCVTSITPSPIDLASPTASFTITGQGFVNNGFGLPVVNFLLGGVVLGQARATGLAGLTGSTLTVPFPTNATSLIGPLPGLVAAVVQVQVYNQTGSSSYALVGSVALTVNDTRPCAPCVTGITPEPIDLASPPTSFTIAGQGFANSGFGLPVVNFLLGGVVLGQARATALIGSTTLAVPFPTNATSLIGPLPGLTAGAVQVQVYNQTGSTSYSLIGGVLLAVMDSRAPSQVRFLNSLVICNPNCQNFTARLTAQEGYTWFSTSGVYSAYEPVMTPTLSSFQAEAIGFGVMLSFPGSFIIARGQRYALVGTLDAANNVVLLLVNEGSLSISASQGLGVGEATLSGHRTGDDAIYFAPAEPAPTHR
jgi:hypothetical protein